MATLTIKDQEFKLKFSIILDKLLNKHIKDDEVDKKGGRERLSGGIQKVLPELIEQDVETLARVFEVAIANAPKDLKLGTVKFDEILEAIDERMNEDNDATKIFSEVFEAIDDSAFSRNELAKFAENMKLVKVLRSDDFDETKAELMLQRMNNGFEKITGKILIEIEDEAKE